MNIVIVSDIHLHEWSYGGDMGPRGTNIRLLDQEYALSQVLSYCEQWEVDTILMGGDLFHTNNRISGAALFFAAQFYHEAARKGIKIYSIVGNHDQCGGGYHSLSWVGSEHHVVDYVYHEEIQGRKFTMMANEPVSSSNVISNELSQASDGDVFLIHQGIAGANVGNGYVLNDEWLSPSFVPEGVQVIAGHYHTPQVMGNILIPGALNQHNWGDAGQKRGFWHWKGDEFLFIESRTTRFHKLDMCDTSGFDDKVIEKLAAPMFTDDGCCGFVRVSNYLGDKEELRGAIYDASDGRCRGIEFEVVKTVSNKEDVDLTAYVDQEKFVKDWIKANRPPHFGSIGTKLYEGTYETP